MVNVKMVSYHVRIFGIWRITAFPRCCWSVRRIRWCTRADDGGTVVIRANTVPRLESAWVAVGWRFSIFLLQAISRCRIETGNWIVYDGEIQFPTSDETAGRGRALCESVRY